MSTIQPQMNTANLASLAGLPMASTGEAPHGLDFLAILANSQAPLDPAQAAPSAAGAELAQGAMPAAGTATGIATGKILPASAKTLADFDPRQAASAKFSRKDAAQATKEIEQDGATIEPATDAMLARLSAKYTKHAPRPAHREAGIDADAARSVETIGLVPSGSEATPPMALIPTTEVTSQTPLRAERFGTNGARPFRSQSARLAADNAQLKPASLTPATMAPLVAEVMEAKPQSARIAQHPQMSAPTAATSTNAIAAASAPLAAERLQMEPVRTPDLAPVPLNRTMPVAPGVSAESLVAARAAAPTKTANASTNATRADASAARAETPAAGSFVTAPTNAPVKPAADFAAPIQPAAQPAAAIPAAVVAEQSSETDALAQSKLTPASSAEPAATGIVLNTATTMPDTARPVTATIAAPVDTIQPQDFDTLVGRLTEAREAASPNLVRAAINHAEFGQISLSFRADESRLAVTMTGSDPALAPAVLAAASAAAAGNEANAREQNAQSQQQAQQQQAQHSTQQHQQQSSGNAGQSGLGNAAQGQADRQAQDGRQTANPRGEASGTSSRDDTAREAPVAPRSNPTGIYA